MTIDREHLVFETSAAGAAPQLVNQDGENRVTGDILVDNGAFAPITTVGTFTGAEAGEGIDLSGNFLYAVNAGGASVGQIRDANFVADTAEPRVTVTANNVNNPWDNDPGFSTGGQDDDRLNTVMESIRWSNGGAGGQVIANLAGLTPGNRYWMQLLLQERCCSRGFDVLVDGHPGTRRIQPERGPGGVHSGLGVVVTYDFAATSTTVEVVLDGLAASFSDQSPILEQSQWRSLDVDALGI